MKKQLVGVALLIIIALGFCGESQAATRRASFDQDELMEVSMTSGGPQMDAKVIMVAAGIMVLAGAAYLAYEIRQVE